MSGKNIFLLVLLLGIFFCWVPKSSAAEKVKLSMELWNRYVLGYENHPFASSNISTSEFSLARGYLRIEPAFSSKITGRFNVDFFSDDINDGAGLKIKYAYLDFSKMLPVKDAKFTFGLFKNYWGTIYDWDYTTIEKDPADKYKFVASVDSGAGISGYLPSGLGDYSLSVYNDEGYKKSGSLIDIHPAYNMNVRVIPFAGITVGGSFRYLNDGKRDDIKTALMTKTVFGPVSILGEFGHSYEEKTDLERQFFMVMPVITLSDSLDLVLRYDYYNKDTYKDAKGENLYMVGVNHVIVRDDDSKPRVWAQLNWQRSLAEDDLNHPSDALAFQMRWAFSAGL